MTSTRTRTTAGFNHFEPVGRAARHIDYATSNKGAAIVDAHDH
jgi:hypothetical protein